MCGGSPKAPPPPPVTPEAPRLAEPTSATGTGDADKRRRAAAQGQSSRSTILTGARGAEDTATTTNKTLLGQ